ncbi:MAG: hypothetical protein M0Z31_07815 [Clostridia bacterium]|nr:hypothetical protein [Clostridia bacterium]
MERFQKNVVIISLIEILKEKGSWCGETHIQKSTYFLQELLEVPLDFEFILYKHGPYSFALTDELTAMRADGLIKLVPQPYPFGPSLLPSDSSKALKRMYREALEKYYNKVIYIAEKLGDTGVASLERLATALYVTLEDEMKDVKSRADRIHRLKPHVSVEEALEAVIIVDKIRQESKEVI